ncbi:MAG: dihydropteroate synthase [Chthoniobacteraceae bacterium]
MHDSSDIPQIIWRTRTREFDLTHRGIVIGILNVTPDSFSDGGRWLDAGPALAHATEMIAHGAEIIDVGGESTRPGAEPVDEGEERRRVLPIIKQLARLPGHGERFVVSIDTTKASVARAAMNAGASVINDVGGFRDPAMIGTAKDTGAGVVVMHMQGEPRTMQSAPHYADVCSEVREFFCLCLERCLASGVARANIAFDPGIGFGKSPEHNLALLQRMNALALPGHALAMGVSRKSFIGKVTGFTAMKDREWPTVALTCHAREHGARVFRVHDVKPNVEALRMTEAILSA